VDSYAIPAEASEPDVSPTLPTPLLLTIDARNTQAVQVIDPRLGKFAVWTQHTIASDTGFRALV
jgi:hypothetical protein